MKDFQRVIMGGSGSTGSSLFNNILGRHSLIYSGIETSLLSKKQLYSNWATAKNRIFKQKIGGLKSHSWHIYNGVDIDYSTGNWFRQNVEKLIETSPSFQHFLDQYFTGLMNGNETIWIEKTPSNAFCFRDFIKTMHNAKAIHMVRNPYDTIASLSARGFSLPYAVGVYLLNTSAALMLKGHNVYTIKYEELLNNQETETTKVCDFLDVDFQSQMLESDKKKSFKMESWNNDEFAKVDSLNAGRFTTLDENAQQEIISAIDLIEVNSTGKKYFKLDVLSIQEICEQLGYEYIQPNKQLSVQVLKKELKKEQLKRALRFYPTGFNFPLSIKQ